MHILSIIITHLEGLLCSDRRRCRHEHRWVQLSPCTPQRDETTDLLLFFFFFKLEIKKRKDLTALVRHCTKKLYESCKTVKSKITGFICTHTDKKMKKAERSSEKGYVCESAELPVIRSEASACLFVFFLLLCAMQKGSSKVSKQQIRKKKWKLYHVFLFLSFFFLSFWNWTVMSKATSKSKSVRLVGKIEF